MPLNVELELAGRLRERRSGLVLEVAGGEWRLVVSTRSRDLVGRDVIVAGRRTGFDEITCEAIWPAGEPRPQTRSFPWEPLIVGGIVVGGYAIWLGWMLIGFLSAR